MKTNGRPRAPSETPATRLGGGMAGLLADMINLAELQFKLLAVDAKESSGRMIVPLGLLAGGVVFALSAFPLALLAVAQVLHDSAGWPPALATLVALLIGLAVAGLMALAGYFGLRRCARPLARSREELNVNIEWLKGTLKRHEHRHVPPNPSARAEQMQ